MWGVLPVYNQELYVLCRTAVALDDVMEGFREDYLGFICIVACVYVLVLRGKGVSCVVMIK